MGLANFSQRFIAEFATKTQPLRELTKKDTPWCWEAEHEKAFEKLKAALTTDTTMSYFDPLEHTEVIVDASPVGLGAILTQRGDAGLRIISYASRALTPVEQRYSQVEREALGVVFGCEKFHLYLYGSPFAVITDTKPLVPLYNNPRSKPPARIERWVLRLQQYDMIVKYRPGANNPADYCSRHPLTTTEESRAEKMAEEYINFIVENASPIAISVDDIKKETLQDSEMQLVAETIHTGKWQKLITKDTPTHSPFRAYHKIKEELCTTPNRDVVLRGTRIVMPPSLRARAIELAHEGHQGLVKSKKLLRTKTWFPKVDQMMAERIDKCIACQANTPPPRPEPLQMSDTPEHAWQEVSADFYGQFQSGIYLLVMIDGYSRYPIVEVVNSTSANTVIPVFDKVFSMMGIVSVLKTDNGPPFNSHQFKAFATNMGFKHQRITPIWPQANGEAERFMRNLGKVTRSAVIEGRPWRQEMYKFLRNYRATPHSSTGIAPATALFGREMKIKLPATISHPQTVELDHALKENDKDAKMKMKRYADRKRHAKSRAIVPGNAVLVRQRKRDKLTSPFDHRPYTVIQKKGTLITAQRGDRNITRN